MDISQSTDIREIVKEIIRLNPGAIIKIDNIDINRISSSIPADKLVLPDGFYYNKKNGITNKHRTKSGSYIAIMVKELFLGKSDLFRNILKKYGFFVISDKLSDFALNDVFDKLCVIMNGYCKLKPEDVNGDLWWESRHLLYLSDLKDMSNNEVSDFATELYKLYTSDKLNSIVESVNIGVGNSDEKIDYDDGNTSEETDNKEPIQEKDSVGSSSDLKDDEEVTYLDRLNEEFLKLLAELKNPSYDRKERSKFVIRVKQIIDIYRNEFNNDAFADTLVKAFNNAQIIYERELKKKESVDLEPKRRGKHFASSKPKDFKAVSLEEDKPITISKDMESKLDEDAQRRVHEIDDRVYKTSDQKVDEMLEKKMNEIHERVDKGETLDSKIDDLSRYVSDLKQRRKEISEQFKDVWTSLDQDRFDELLEEDNKTRLMISQNESEIKRRTEIRDMVDEQIAREEVTRDIERFESDVDFVNNSSFTDEQKKILIDGIYAEFDKYVEEHPEKKGRSR